MKTADAVIYHDGKRRNSESALPFHYGDERLNEMVPRTADGL
ncbi:MAG: hypothetical protein ACLRMW_06265 [[Clostridium] symbiosum]